MRPTLYIAFLLVIVPQLARDLVELFWSFVLLSSVVVEYSIWTD